MLWDANYSLDPNFVSSPYLAVRKDALREKLVERLAKESVQRYDAGKYFPKDLSSHSRTTVIGFCNQEEALLHILDPHLQQLILLASHDPERPLLVNAILFLWIQQATGADGVFITTKGDEKTSPIILAKGNEPIAMLMPVSYEESITFDPSRLPGKREAASGRTAPSLSARDSSSICS
jgi:hypothetical protein